MFRSRTPCRTRSDCTDKGRVASVHTDALYGNDYKWDRCGKLSPACEKWFVEEACFYECDVNIAKFRVEQECEKADGTANDNLWQVMGVPMKASQCDQWYADCKDDLFCAGDETKGYWDMATCDHQKDCKPFKELYSDGKDICEVMWGGSFKYETDEKSAYSFTFPPGVPNPNDLVLPSTLFPANHCKGNQTDECPSKVEFSLIQRSRAAEKAGAASALKAAAEMAAMDSRMDAKNARMHETVAAMQADLDQVRADLGDAEKIGLGAVIMACLSSAVAAALALASIWGPGKPAFEDLDASQRA